MFELFNVDLVHGWIADPQVREKIYKKDDNKNFNFKKKLGY